MRVAFISEPWDDVGPAGDGSSIAIVTARLATRLARHASILIYSARRVPGRPETERDAAGIEYRRIPITPEKYVHRAIVDLEPNIDSGWFRLPYWASSFYYRGYAQKIARDLATKSFDIVHVHSLSQFVPIIRRFNPQIKIVLHLHNDQLALLDRERAAARLQHVDLVIGCSDYIVEGLRTRFPEHARRCLVLYNGVDLDRFAPVRHASAGTESDELRCLHVARMSPEKGLHVLLDAFERVRKRYPRARLDVYGSKVPLPYNFYAGLSQDPAMRTLKECYPGTRTSRLMSSLMGRRLEYFTSLQRQHGELFDRAVFFHGTVPQGDLRQAYQNADMFVLPSVFHEPFGMVLIEAMASAVPVVTTRGGEITEAVAEAGAGLVVERNDPAALAEAMLELAADPARRARMGERGRAFAASDAFSWDRIADQLCGYYRDVLEGTAHIAHGENARTARRVEEAAGDD